MKHELKGIISAALLLAAGGATAYAAAAPEEPIITFRTSIYDTFGPGNSFTLVIGATEAGYIDVDCGFGTVEYELEESTFDSTTGSIGGTFVTCSVNSDGIVKIYGDASKIDYFNAAGCYIRNIDMTSLSNLTILNLEHNELTGLDLTPFNRLQFVYLSDNPYSQATPLVIGKNKPELVLLQIGISDYLDPDFNLSDYPAMVSFDAYAANGLTSLDPTGCPELVQLSLDVTPVSSLDISKNPKLKILNIADTKITEIDLSNAPLLTELYANHSGSKYASYKLKSLDVSKNPELYYLFAGYNDLETLDVSKNPKLFDLSIPFNKLTEIDLSANTNLYNVNIDRNYFTFATMPANPGDWGNYFYNQRNHHVARSYKVGSELDFSSTMLREGTETVATMYYPDETGLSAPRPVDTSAYKFENGKLSLLKEITDSVYVAFENSMFDEYPIFTTNFVVKSEAEFGQDIKALYFSPGVEANKPVSFTLGIDGATPDSPKMFTVDFGDGEELVPFTATGSTIADGCTVSGIFQGGTITVFTPEGVDVTAFSVENTPLYLVNFTNAPMLRELKLVNTELYSIDLSGLRCLQSIYITGNHFYNFSLEGKSANYNKTVLTNLYIPNNGINTFRHGGLHALQHIDISGNSLTEFEFDTAVQAIDINLANNQLTEANLSACESLRSIDLSSNMISELKLPVESVLESLKIGNNRMTLANLPRPALFSGEYTYAPQAKIGIPVKAPGADLASQHLTINGKTTQYAWFKADGTAITEGTDYTVTDGKTRFLNTELGKVYCAITHEAFPQFSIENGTALTTTEIEVAPMPTNVLASFTTTTNGESVTASLAAMQPNTTIYFDWKGDGVDLESYDLDTTYRLFYATTTAGANVKVYSYDDAAPLSVFSITGASMSDIDLSKLTSVRTLSLSNTHLDNIELPASPMLAELTLEGNNISAIDLSAYTNIYSLSLANNKFSGSFDLSKYPNLQVVSLAANNLTDVSIKNPALWHLDLSGNKLATLNLDGAPGLEQVILSANELSELSIENLKNLRVLFIDANRFTFATLPSATPSLSIYYYTNQQRITVVPDGLTIDLSAQAKVGNVETTFTWFLDEPQRDEEGNWVGEDLYENDEYFVDNGVCTFSQAFIHLVGLLKNLAFPQLELFTNMTDLSGVENVSANNDATIAVRGKNIVITSDGSLGAARVYSVSGSLIRKAYTIAGETLISELPAGIYIVAIGGTTAKVALP